MTNLRNTFDVHRLSTVFDALARPFGLHGAADPRAADERWLGWDAWVCVATDLHDRAGG